MHRVAQYHRVILNRRVVPYCGILPYSISILNFAIPLAVLPILRYSKATVTRAHSSIEPKAAPTTSVLILEQKAAALEVGCRTRPKSTGGVKPVQQLGLSLPHKEPFLEAHDGRGWVAAEEHVTRLELVYPWMCYHSSLKGRLGDETMLGGRLSQLEKTFESINRGPLSDEAVNWI
jgi:hypothetical protein